MNLKQRMKQSMETISGRQFEDIYPVNRKLVGHMFDETDTGQIMEQLNKEFGVAKAKWAVAGRRRLFRVFLSWELFSRAIEFRQYDMGDVLVRLEGDLLCLNNGLVGRLPLCNDDSETYCFVDAWLELVGGDGSLEGVVPLLHVVDRDADGQRNKLRLKVPTVKQARLVQPAVALVKRIQDDGPVCCNVRFKPSFVPFLTEMAALWRAPKMCYRPCENRRSYNLMDIEPKMDVNEAQLNAVRRVVCFEPRLAEPFVVFGPPGTGKTFTIIESIIQLLALKPSTSVLYTAPSNQSCDEFAQRLLVLPWIPCDWWVRFNSKYRRTKPPPSLDLQSTTEVNACRMRRLVIATVHSSSQLVNIADSQFVRSLSHVFIDEANTATEPQCLVPAQLMSKTSKARIILTGDRHQLGPVIQSPVARRSCLATSPVEHLLSCKAYYDYVKKEYNEELVARLVVSYRSVPELLRVPNHFFYSNVLRTGIRETEIAKMHQTGRQFVKAISSRLNIRPTSVKNSSLVYLPVVGTQQLEVSDTSSYNSAEIRRCVDCVRALLKMGLSPGEIGILSPYRLQSEKLQRKLVFSKVISKQSDLFCGSTEMFQGQERRVLIVTTVCSKNSVRLNPTSSDSTSTDDGQLPTENEDESNFSFLFNKKRFNVAITRARDLLVVVGNPAVLGSSHYWRYLIDRCVVFPQSSGADDTVMTASPREELPVPSRYGLSGTKPKSTWKPEKTSDKTKEKPSEPTEMEDVVVVNSKKQVDEKQQQPAEGGRDEASTDTNGCGIIVPNPFQFREEEGDFVLVDDVVEKLYTTVIEN